jgi:small subunit ribosomal protein S17
MADEKKPAEAADERTLRKTFVGIVRSAKMNKTIVVEVERFFRHPKFGKYIKRYTRCYTHDEKGEAKEGDRVEIMETRPMSKTKRWRLVRVIERAWRPEEAAAPKT